MSSSLEDGENIFQPLWEDGERVSHADGATPVTAAG
jgi:hypothetical protein